MHRTPPPRTIMVFFLLALAASCYDKAPIISSDSCDHVKASCIEVDGKARLLKDHFTGARISFDSIQVFGDSLSDIGRYHGYTRGLVFPETIYWKGRASNGPIWIDYVVGALGIPAYNYAFAGAPTRPPKFPYHFIFPSLQEQIEEYKVYRVSQNTAAGLAVLWIGGNNYIYSGKRTDVVNYTLTDIKASADKIISSGVQGLILVNLPDLSDIQYLPKDFSRDDYRLRLKNFSEEHNQKLPEIVEELKKLHPGKLIHLMDVFAMGKDLHNEREKFGFCEFGQACYRGEFFSLNDKPQDVCVNPDGHWSWDAVHPTTRVHCYYALQFFDSLNQMGMLNAFSKEKALEACMSADRKACP